MKADKITIWAAIPRAGCAVAIDHGMEMANFRWFNWDERLTDGGNKRLEIIRDAMGKEVRISTISHLRAGEVIWAPKPEDAASPCAPAGNYQITKLDMRWSTGGTAYGVESETVMGKGTFPIWSSDAKAITRAPEVMGTMTALAIKDITDSSILRAPKFEFEANVNPESALPWSLFLTKYAEPLIFRQNDDSLLRRVLPLDLANSFYFTKANIRLSLPESTAQTAAILPSAGALDLAAVNLSSTFISAKAALLLKGEQPGELRLNAMASGVGLVESVIGFRTQMFGKDMLRAASEGKIDMHGKTGVGVTSAALKFRDEGVISAFSSLFKNSPATLLQRTARKDIEFWNVVTVWLRRIGEGKEPTLSVIFAAPRLMVDGFWGSAFDGAVAKVEG